MREECSTYPNTVCLRAAHLEDLRVDSTILEDTVPITGTIRFAVGDVSLTGFWLNQWKRIQMGILLY